MEPQDNRIQQRIPDNVEEVILQIVCDDGIVDLPFDPEDNHDMPEDFGIWGNLQQRLLVVLGHTRVVGTDQTEDGKYVIALQARPGITVPATEERAAA